MAAIDALLSAALRTFIDLHEAQFGNVQILDFRQRKKVLVIRAHHGFKEPFLRTFARVSGEDDCACGRALKLGRTVVISDTEEDATFAPYCEVSRAAGFRAVISTPIQMRGLDALGCISAHFAAPHIPNATVVGRGEIFAAGLFERVASLLEPEGAPPRGS